MPHGRFGNTNITNNRTTMLSVNAAIAPKFETSTTNNQTFCRKNSTIRNKAHDFIKILYF